MGGRCHDASQREHSAAALVARIAAGSAGAERELVERYSPGLRYVIDREVRDADMAEDIYQECILIAIRRLRAGSLEQPAKLGAFLVGIARRLVKARRRHEARYVYHHGLLEGMADHCALPDEEVARSQEARFVRTALSCLTVKRDRDVLMRCYILGEERELLCSALGLSSEQLNKVLHRARLRLRKQVERQ